MIITRKSSERGHENHGWLDSYHTFSFADYYDPQHMGYSALRVINEDRVQPAQGFPTHGHRDMEIISYVLEGALEHKDSMGNGSVIRPGDVQRMSAGSGVRHSEYNASATELVHFLQIWIQPNIANVVPSYEQAHFPREALQGRLRLIASPDGRDGSVTIHQDARLYALRMNSAEAVEYRPAAGRWVYIHVARGSMQVNGVALGPGDGARIEDEAVINIADGIDAEALLFDLP